MVELTILISDKLLNKGFTPVEISDLLNDLSHLFKQGNKCTIKHVNQELENLGWGFQILDESLFKEIVSLLVSTNETFKQN